MFYKPYGAEKVYFCCCFVCFSPVKIPLSDQLLGDLCGLLSLPWIYSHPDDSSFKPSMWGFDPLVLSQKTVQGFCKYVKVCQAQFHFGMIVLEQNYFICFLMMIDGIRSLNQVIICFVFSLQHPRLSHTVCSFCLCSRETFIWTGENQFITGHYKVTMK